MKLLFKQRVFSWFDSYDIYDEDENIVFRVEGQLSWGHCLHICDAAGRHVGTIRERLLTFRPQFAMYEGDTLIGTICKEFSFFLPRFTVDCKGWQVDGQIMEWDYTISDRCDRLVASVEKRLFQWSDTYVLDIVKPEDALYVLMVVLAIDAEKCSRN